MKVLDQVTQGDVIFERIDEYPDDIIDGEQMKLDDFGRLLLLEGEATGHFHRIEADVIEPHVKIEEPTLITMFFSLPKGGVIVHDTHDPISIDAGQWIAGTQRQYTREKIQRILD